MSKIIEQIEQTYIRKGLPEFRVGDTVRVGVKVVEGNRERVQDFEGVVIRHRSTGINENFTVRRIASHGVGVERTFLLNSPRLDSLKVVRRGKVRRAKLYYLRGRTGRAARIKERRITQQVQRPEVAPVVEPNTLLVAPAMLAPESITPDVEPTTTPEQTRPAAEE